MGWREKRAARQGDPEYQRIRAEEFPFASVANAVAKLRAQRGLTQKALADQVGTQQSVIARLESGRHAVSTDLLSRIATALDLEWEPVFKPRNAPMVPAAEVRETIRVAIAAKSFSVRIPHLVEKTPVAAKWFASEWPTAFALHGEEVVQLGRGFVVSSRPHIHTSAAPRGSKDADRRLVLTNH